MSKRSHLRRDVTAPGLGFAVVASVVMLSGCALEVPAASGRGQIETTRGRLSIEPVFPGYRAEHLDRLIQEHPATVDHVFSFTYENEGRKQQSVGRLPVFDVVDLYRADQGIVRKLRRRPLKPADSAASQPAAEETSDAAADDWQAVEYEFLTPGSADESYDEFRDRVSTAMFLRELMPDIITFYEPRVKPNRGLVVCGEPLMTTAYDQAVIARFVERGWAVVSVRFATLLGPSVRFDLACDEDIEAAAVRAAKLLDREEALFALRAEGFLDYLRVRRPDVVQSPMAAIGFSAGAIGLSTVSARIAERLDSVVYVAGGAITPEICMTSDISSAGLIVRWHGKAAPDSIRKRFNKIYLENCHLDGFHTAAWIRKLPVLMLHGLFDTGVPAGTGDILYERLARPERWVFLGGHGLVFWLLPSQADRIVDWVERHASRSDQAIGAGVDRAANRASTGADLATGSE